MRTVKRYLQGLCPFIKLNKKRLYGEAAHLLMSCQCVVTILLVTFHSLLQTKAIEG